MTKDRAMNIDINTRNFERANETLRNKSQELDNILGSISEYAKECEGKIKDLEEEIKELSDKIYNLEEENKELKERMGL